VATDSAGDLYALDSGNNRIQKFSGTGTFITKFGGGCGGLATDSLGNVYATTGPGSTNRILRYSPTG
jgi:tripartite motif-containing protein 71